MEKNNSLNTGSVKLATPREDLTGKTYGSLKVRGRGPDTNPTGKYQTRRVRWDCQCSCGKEMLLRRDQILNPEYQICRHTEEHRHPSIRIGDTFGSLTVIAAAPDHYTPSGIKKPMWLCRCECGNEITAQQQRLKLGEVTSCGCKRKGANPFRNVPITYDLTGDFGIGHTARGEQFFFDLKDYGKIKDYRWYYNKRGRLQATVRGEDGKNKAVYFNQLVMGETPEGKEIGYIHHPEGIGAHKEDNRKENLQFVTAGERRRSAGIRCNNTSGHTGVCRNKANGGWTAYTTVDGKGRSKSFPADQKAEACACQEELAVEMQGEYAYRGSTPLASMPAAQTAQIPEADREEGPEKGL